MRNLVIAFVVAVALVGGCNSGGGSPNPGDDEPDSYENHVYFSCNGTVLADRTFTSKPACEAFAEEFGIQYCGTTKFQVSC
jgi:hypothetical protein